MDYSLGISYYRTHSKVELTSRRCDIYSSALSMIPYRIMIKILNEE